MDQQLGMTLARAIEGFTLQGSNLGSRMSIPQPGACSHQSGQQGRREPVQSDLPVMHSLTVTSHV